MLSWKQAQGGSLKLEKEIPKLLYYALDRERSEKNKNATLPKGAGLKLLAHLAPVAEELDFGVYIADISLHRSGWANVGRKDFGRPHDPEDLDFDRPGDYEEELLLEDIVDPDGMPCSNASESSSESFIYKEDVIPVTFGSGEPDKKKYRYWEVRCYPLIRELIEQTTDIPCSSE